MRPGRDAEDTESATGGPFDDEDDATGRVTLSSTRTDAISTLQVQVTGISELGVRMNEHSGSSVRSSYTLSYAEAQPTNAELPAVIVGMRFVSSGGRRGALSDQPLPIRTCSFDEESGCCPPGEPECSLTVEMVFSRSADVFPEVNVDWTATAVVEFTSCEGDGPVTVSIEEAP